MSAPLNRFNSGLLNLVKKHYKGPFQQKINEAFAVERWDEDLGKAVSSMFRISEEQIVRPSPSSLINYGKGDIGNDYLVTLYIDDKIGKMLQELRKEEIDFRSFKNLLDELSFLQNINQSSPEALYFRKILYDAFMNFGYWATSNLRSASFYSFFNDPYVRRLTGARKFSFRVTDTEKLAFLGIASLMSVFLADQEMRIKGRFDHPPYFNFKPTTHFPKPWLQNQHFFPLGNIMQKERFYLNPIFPYFEDFNNRYIAKAKPDLPSSISNLLSSSSFIWERDIFDIDPGALEAMTDEQRLDFLLKRKNALINRCFEYLERQSVKFIDDFSAKGGSSSMHRHGSMMRSMGPIFKALREERNESLKLSENIQGILDQIEEMKEILEKATFEKRKIRESINELSSSFADQNDAEFEAELLTILERSSPPTDIEVPGLGKMIMDLARNYRSQVLIESRQQERIVLATQDLSLRREELAKKYVGIADQYLKKINLNESFLNRFLEVHTVFSYFVFNVDLFPKQISFSKKKERRALQRFMRREERDPHAFGIQGTIQAFLNEKSKKIFGAFKDYRSGKTRALNPQEIRSIEKVTRDIQQNPQQLSKFEKLEGILEKLLVKDEGFVRTCEALADDFSLEDVVKLQTHMNACLMFANGYESSDATGLKRSEGFKKLSEGVQSSQSSDEIRVRPLEVNQRILDQMESFNYPQEVRSSFSDNVQAAYLSRTPQQLRDEELRAAPVDISQFPQVREKKLLLDDLMKKILSRATRGESSFLSSRKSKKHFKNKFDSPFLRSASSSIDQLESLREDESATARDAIRNVFAGDFGSSLYKVLERRFKTTVFSYDEIVAALRSFVGRENIDLDLFSPSKFQELLRVITTPSEVHTGVLIAMYETLRKEYNQQSQNLERLHITEAVSKFSPGSSSNRASVFDNTTLFRYYKNQSGSFSKNYKESEDMYEQFLPLFLTSYLADVSQLNFGQAFFVQAKLDAIKDILPGVEQVYGELDAFFISKGRQLARLADFFKEQEGKAGFLEEGFLNNLRDYIRKNILGPIAGMEEAALVAAIAGVGILIYTGSPILCVIGGMAMSYFWKTGIKPFLKDVFNFARESANYILGNGYTPEGINDYILDLFKVALQTEVKVSQAQNKGEEGLDIQHLFSNALFLQEEFSILRNSRYSLHEFRNRLHMLIPNAIVNANFSTMLLNMFFKFNESLFLSTPTNLMKNSNNPLFSRSLRDYLRTYDETIAREKERFLADGHEEEETILKLGAPSPFRDYLIQRSREGNLSLSFPRDSSVHLFLSNQLMNLNNPHNIPLEETQIVPMSLSHTHIESFLDTIDATLGLQPQFLGAIRPVILRTRGLMSPQREHRNAFKDGLRTSYFLMRYAFDSARSLDNVFSSIELTGKADYWLSSTNETGQSIFLSPLFRETFSLLMKTAEFASSTGMPEGGAGVRILDFIQENVDTYLRTGRLHTIPLGRFQELEDVIRTLIEKSETEPQIMFPILFEKDRNQNIQLPIIIWNLAQKALDEDLGPQRAASALSRASSSSAVYQSNQSIELLFSSSEGRGFALSPMVMNILEDSLRRLNDRTILRFLGILNERDQARFSAFQTPDRLLLDQESFAQSAARSAQRQRQQPPASSSSDQASAAPAPQSPLSSPQTEQPLQQPQEAPLSFDQNWMQGFPQSNLPRRPEIGEGVYGQGVAAEEEYLGSQGAQPQPQAGVQDQTVPQPQVEPTQSPQLLPFVASTPQPSPQQPILPEQPQTQELPPQAAPTAATPQQQQNYVMLGADGSSGSFAGGAAGGVPPEQAPVPQDPVMADLRARSQRYAQEPPTVYPPIGPDPSQPYRGPMNIDDFQQYQQEIAQPVDGYGFEKAAAIGGGLFLGGALLAQLMINKRDKEEKRK